MAGLLPERESLTVEFKSDRARLPDDELVEAAVCLANTDGGVMFVGVEEDGTPTGLHPDHRNVSRLAALVANRTVPPLSVRAEVILVEGLPIARIEVPRFTRIVATTGGLVKRRRINLHGQPECVPFRPHEFASRQSDLGFLDYAALPVVGASSADFDPLEHERLRRMVERYNGDRALLSLSDTEIDGALGLVGRDETGKHVPTVLGLLLVGREEALRRHVPAHEVAFQVLEGEVVRFNEFTHAPLLRAFERVMDLFSARNDERELMMGMFRVPVPLLDVSAFREALANALTHRDYTRLGAIHVRWETDLMVVSNPGGFVDGVTLDNLLVVEPRPRNPSLADAFKRIGIVERTGRGVDTIYRGLLAFGRPVPDYHRSDAWSVIVRLSTAETDLDFVRFRIGLEERRNALLSTEDLIILSLLWDQRRLDVVEGAQAIQQEASVARRALERLVESGVVEAHGRTKGRGYTLSASVYRELGMAEAYVRQQGFDPIQQEEMVRTYVMHHGSVRRHEVVGLCRITEDQAKRLLLGLRSRGILTQHGQGKGTHYTAGPAFDQRK